MINLASSALAIVAVAISSLPSTSAFSTSEMNARMRRMSMRSKGTYLEYQPGTYNGGSYDGAPVPPGPPPPGGDIAGAYDRALDCANNFGMCDIDELLDLSEELDEYLECYVEDGPEACEREIDDRQYLSEALLVQGEMREHQRYIEEGNIFAYEDNGLVNGIDTASNDGSGSSPRTSVWREEDDFLWGDDTSLGM